MGFGRKKARPDLRLPGCSQIVLEAIHRLPSPCSSVAELAAHAFSHDAAAVSAEQIAAANTIVSVIAAKDDRGPARTTRSCGRHQLTGSPRHANIGGICCFLAGRRGAWSRVLRCLSDGCLRVEAADYDTRSTAMRDAPCPCINTTSFDKAFLTQTAPRSSAIRSERWQDGRLSEDQFRPLRLQNGWYVQRHTPMLRVAVPYGELSSAQLRVLGPRRARIRRSPSRGLPQRAECAAQARHRAAAHASCALHDAHECAVQLDTARRKRPT